MAQILNDNWQKINIFVPKLKERENNDEEKFFQQRKGHSDVQQGRSWTST
jgi:hypothetical protein